MWRVAVASVLAVMTLATVQPARAGDVAPQVVIYENTDSYLLENGYLAAMISKTSGEIVSLKLGDKELLADAQSRAPGTWFNKLAGTGVTARVSIDPTANQGERGEVSISVAGPLAIDMRYSLARGDHGFYACQILKHPPNAAGAHIASGGFQLRLDPNLFDTFTAGKGHSHPIPTAEDWLKGQVVFSPEARRMTSGKLQGQLVCFWDDALMQMENPVYGFSGTKSNVGVWVINPSPIYLSRGGNVIEPTGWLDPADGTPTLLNRWGGEPGAGFSIGRGDLWTHVIGPFLIYCNDGTFADAQGRAKLEQGQWPYAWADKDEYVPSQKRGALVGQVFLTQSPLATKEFPTTPPLAGQGGPVIGNQYAARAPAVMDVPTTQLQAITNLQGAMVGLTSDADWQTNYFDHQIWTRVADDGTFSFANVLPGTYDAHIYCDGQIGEGLLSGILIEAGKTRDMGKVTWTPPHHGQFVWQMGYPDRSAGEYRHGDDASRWGHWALDPKEFPNGVNYVIGMSDPHLDWNYAQTAGSTWKIHFKMGFVPDQGEGFLDVAMAGGSSGAKLTITLNGNNISGHDYLPVPPINRPAGSVQLDDIARGQVRGYYLENIYRFDPKCLQLGDNVMLFHVDGRKATDGFMYDCMRLEIRADSVYLAGQDPNNPPYEPGPMPLDSGWNFGSHYVGDPSGNYTGLGVTPRSGGSKPPP